MKDSKKRKGISPRTKKVKQKKRIKIKKKKVLKALVIPFLVITMIIFGVSLRSALNIKELETQSGWVGELAELEGDEEEVEEEEINTVLSILDHEDNLDYIVLMNYTRNKGLDGEKDSDTGYDDITGIILPSNTYVEVENGTESNGESNDESRKTLKEVRSREDPGFLLNILSKNFEINFHNLVEVNTELAEILADTLALPEEIDLSTLKTTASKEIDEDEVINRFLVKEEVLLEIIDAYMGEAGFWNRSSYLNKIATKTETNLTWEESERFLTALKEIFSKEDEIYLLPGAEEKIEEETYWVMDHEESRNLIEEVFFPDQMVYREMTSEDVSVEIISYGRGEKAQNVKETLNEKGFVVKSVEELEDKEHGKKGKLKEAKINHDSILVISRTGPENAAKMVALEVDGANLLNKPDPDSQVMVSVIIGDN